MAEPFKNLIGAELVRTARRHLQRVWPKFAGARFERLATNGLDALELKARTLHVAAALEATLPDDFDAAATVLERSLLPVGPDTPLAELRTGATGLAGWVVWPMTEFVVRRGMPHPARALRALHALTQRNTAEYALRPFFDAHRDVVLATLRTWLRDPSMHVRRLVSEGTRPRLPWGMQLRSLIADPSPTLPFLVALQDDPSEYVRRSVANHLNDIAKDHPHVVAEWLERHLPAASPQRRALLKHASRTLVKRGDRRVLAAWGLGAALRGDASLTIEPKTARIGDAVTLRVVLRSTATKSQRLVVDYAVHHVKANGAARPKVWKGWSLELPPRGARELERRHSLAVVTTRRLHPGRHAVDLLVNGEIVASSAFTLRA